MEDHSPWLLVIYAATVFVVVASNAGPARPPRRTPRTKPGRQAETGTVEPYESGIRPTGTTQTRWPIQYYLVAMFFVIFDLESVFLYAWAVAVRESGWLGFAEAALFVIVLLAALAYLWRIGALDWSAEYQRPTIHRLPRSKTKEELAARVA